MRTPSGVVGEPRLERCATVHRAMSSSTRSALIAMAAADPSPAAVITCARGLADVPGRPDTGHARLARGVDPERSPVRRPRSRAASIRPRRRRDAARPDEERRARNGSAVAEHHTPSGDRHRREPRTSTLDDADVACVECSRSAVGELVRVREEDEVVRPLPDELRVVDGAGARFRARRSADREPPSRGSRGSGGSHGPSAPGRRGSAAARRPRRSRAGAAAPSSVAPSASGPRSPCSIATTLVVDELDAVAADFVAPGGRRSAGGIPSRERKPCMCAAGAFRGVAGIDDGDPSPRPAEHERRAQPGGAASNHHNVIACCIHALDACRRRRETRQLSLLFLGTRQ